MKKLIILLFTIFLSVGSLPAQSTDVKKLIQLANQGNANAQFNLGYMYAKGEGVPQDDAQAMKWFNLAAAQGNENGKKGRDLVAQMMTPQKIAQAQELARNWKPKKNR